MKRSEMINKMVEVMKETEYCSEEVRMKAILAMQMESGMMPPQHKEHHPMNNIFYVMSWEPENEAK